MDIQMREGRNSPCPDEPLREQLEVHNGEFCLPDCMSHANFVEKDGFVHVKLRQLPCQPGAPPDQVKIEMSVHDTGKVRHTSLI